MSASAFGTVLQGYIKGFGSAELLQTRKTFLASLASFDIHLIRVEALHFTSSNPADEIFSQCCRIPCLVRAAIEYDRFHQSPA
jgi:hypothetical protein